MAGLFPTDIKIRTVKITSYHQTLLSDSQSFKQQVRSKNTQRFGFTIETVPLQRPQWSKLMAFLEKQNGRYETFEHIPNMARAPMGSGIGTPVVVGASQTGSSVVTGGWPVSSSGMLKAGDFIKFANHSKVYQVMDDITSDIAGQSTINIRPGLIQPPADASAITIRDVPFTVRLQSDAVAFEFDDLNMSVFKMDCMEAF